MILNALQWLIGLILAISVTYFAVLNRHIINITYSPTHEPIAMPLYLPILGFAAFAFLLGAMSLWLRGRKRAKEIRIQNKEIKKLKAETDLLNMQKTYAEQTKSNQADHMIGQASILPNTNSTTKH